MGRIFCVVIGVALLSGCQSPVVTPRPQARRAVALPALAAGQHCVITLKSESPDTTLSYHGKIKSTDDETIVLDRPTRTARQRQSPPLIGRLPIVGRQFKNVGIGSQAMKEDVTVSRVDIADVQLVSQDPSAAELKAANMIEPKFD